MVSLSSIKIGVIGLGYVGLPLAVEFSKKYQVIGFDIDNIRISDLTSDLDSTLELSKNELVSAKNIFYTDDLSLLKDCNVYIVTVPTPIDEHRQPDFKPLLEASGLIGSVMSENDVVIYESTVYPGATEELCVPVLERVSKLNYNNNFFVGYSPERINPGDKTHRLADIVKVTSGSNKDTANFVDSLYGSIITAGTHCAPSIKVAEAAKVIENTQRDVNIALINELSIIFNKLQIDTLDVLEAAGTKWNFLPFRPGLVGGHCIGVDPYYLTHKAQSVGYHPEMILAGRRINDGMGKYVVDQLIKILVRKKIQVFGAKVLVMGLTFKENCPDIRNTKVIDIVRELDSYKMDIDVVDPWCSKLAAQQAYNLNLTQNPQVGEYDAILLAVAHKQFLEMGIDKIRTLGKKNHVVYDMKFMFKSNESDIRL
jgi:UDP-N-acetyl-D-glucosamine/UDP-N-acetyl-D-galactosamine dehydrogenase